ncbi:NADH-quinone oxidoreductase subunit NuoG [Escherichia albertii]|uniref:NADH-quinone oxidoreductase subunit NuoG n=1 Tax=Escherichia albertii TaxID=208962 RepID=UPI00169CBB76|nr:NADH-quinone oxidoreductase subunit NuoG [Escherichia albertii]MCQ8935102.1 NADH-quinone oxidoreductase subunit NuoG [Escherichia albertii]MCZ8687995.1 NADH-quinone oxidoreductase subunit NuoG [Escherichia albertii]MCZ8729490.1 NADH-quinone oxidoreductase subunit NuoG [Escherichia albertii]MCZ8881833.1 NADH-quinone oxidoreductase subunit NuoG [Escherichia albertii]MCZ8894395.1 NADH-quinone oxidoreductase subunit NuoG [Escherichia albertii]
MATIHVDGKEYEVNGADNLLEACLSLGLDIPYFCWHPALGSVGACRQCAVKQYQNAEDTRGRLVMSCMTPASDGTFISIDDEEAKQFRESVVEWLMTNHPHDCPVCEEGGNCHLQDMTVMTGHSFRRYRFTKRTHRNQDLGPFISHEMNRCIACYRCVRYYKDYADGTDLGVYGAHDNVYFGRPEDGTLESEFSGNLVEICPTGVFTDKTHSERYNRKWDMQFAPSICQQCSIGCNISPGERYGELRRIENRYNGTVNHYFLCDRGRFGYGYVNLKDRPRQPVQRRGDDFITLNAEQAMQGAADILRQSKKVIGIGSPRASVESNFALRELVGEENFYTGIAHGEQERLQLALKVLREGGIYTPALREIESYDAVLVLGEDVTQTGARVALAVRQAVKGKAREMAAAQKVADWQIAAILNIGQRAKHPLFVTNVDDTRLDDIAAWTYRAPVEDQARLGFAIAHALDNAAPTVDGIEPELQSKIDVIVQALAGAKKPLIISGTNAGSLEVIQAAANVAKALKGRGADVGITMIARSVNSMGLGIMGGGSLEEALTELETGRADAVVVLENDLHRHASATRVNAALAKAPLVMVVDHQRTAIMENAHLVLSAASFAESDGTVINNEGRAQRFFQVYDPAYYDSKTVMLESWRWLHSLHSTLLSREVDWTQLDHVIDAVVAKIPELAGIKDAAPDATFRIRGQKLAREPHRYSGRTAMRANISVHEPRQPQDIDTMFTFSMEGNNQPTAHRSQVPFAWAPGWNSPQAWNKFQDEVGGKLRFGDPGVRLFETSENGLDYFTSVPARFQPQAGKWRIAPYYHLFGSDELSQRAPVFQSRMPQPYIKLNPADAAKLGVNAGTRVSFSYDGNMVTLPVEIAEGLTAGQVGLPMGMSGIAPVLAGAHLEDLKEAQQ